MLVSFLNVNLLLSVYNLCVCYLINRKVRRSLKHRSLKLWQRDLMSKLITLALLEVPSTLDGSLAGHTASASEQVALEENAPKKPRLE